MPAFVPRLRLRSEAEASKLPREVLAGPELEMLQQKASGTGYPAGIRRLPVGGSRWKMPSACECVLGCGCVLRHAWSSNEDFALSSIGLLLLRDVDFVDVKCIFHGTAL